MVWVRTATIMYRLHFNNEHHQMAKILSDSTLSKSQDLVITVTQFLEGDNIQSQWGDPRMSDRIIPRS